MLRAGVPMSDNQTHPPAESNRWRWIAGISLVLAVIIAGLAGIVISHAEPILRERVTETLSTRFNSKVELDGFHVSLLRGFEVSGEGLRLFGDTDPNNHEPGIQPLIGVAQFRFRTGLMDLLRSPMHVSTAYVKGLSLNLPPREQRAQMRSMAPRDGRIKIVVDKLI